MSKMKQHYEEKAELALMGKAVPVESEAEVKFITDYIRTVIGVSAEWDIYERLHQYNKENKVTHICTNKVMDMPCITYCIDPQDGETPKPFKEDYGTGTPCSFCYVYNLVADDMCSEFGDCFFEKKLDGYYHRVS